MVDVFSKKTKLTLWCFKREEDREHDLGLLTFKNIGELCLIFKKTIKLLFTFYYKQRKYVNIVQGKYD